MIGPKSIPDNQRHAALASSAVAEHGAHRQTQGALRSSAETAALVFHLE